MITAEVHKPVSVVQGPKKSQLPTSSLRTSTLTEELSQKTSKPAYAYIEWLWMTRNDHSGGTRTSQCGAGAEEVAAANRQSADVYFDRGADPVTQSQTALVALAGNRAAD